jgi:tyrosine-protein kinase Etk/Wzc
VAIGAIFGLLVAALVAWFLASRRPWAYDADQVAQLIDAPFLGDVSAPGSVRRLGAALKGSHDGYELVSTTVSSLVSEGVVLMVSPTHALGRTETTLHAALSAAQKGRRVLLVDADNRRRELTQALGLSQSPGLVNVLRGTATLDEAARRILLDKVSVAGIGSGPQVDDSVSLYQSPSALQFLSTARSAFDLVIIDCAPLLDSAAASALARGADHVVLVVEAGTPLGVVKRASQQLSLLGLPVVGFVFARRHSSSASTHAVR